MTISSASRRRGAAAAVAALTLAFSLGAEALPILPPDPAERPPPARAGALSSEALDAVLARFEPAKVTETAAAAEVPEPDSLLLLAVGLAPWGLRWHHRRRAQQVALNVAAAAVLAADIATGPCNSSR